MPKKVFISYRRTDASAAARSLFGSLKEHFGPGRVFFDTSGVSKGVDFVAKLNEVLDESGVVLAVIGQGWTNARDDAGARRLDNAGDYVRVEIETALEKRIPIIPVMVEGASLPAVTDLPKSLQPLLRYHGMSVSHDNFDSDVAALIASVEPMVGQAPVVGRVSKALVTGAAAIGRTPLWARTAMSALLVALLVMLLFPRLAPGAFTYADAYIRVSTNPTRIPLSRGGLAEIRQILASTEEQWCPRIDEDLWFSAQSYAACGGPPSSFADFNRLVLRDFDRSCRCWRYEEKSLTHLFFWIFEDYSLNHRQVDEGMIRRLLQAQRSPGNWPTHLDDGQLDEKEPLYVTALIVIALAHQRPLIEDAALQREVARAVRRGAAWLAQQEPANPEDWMDYVNTTDAIHHRLFGGMALTAIAEGLSEAQTAAMARRWTQGLSFDQASLFISSDVRHYFAGGRSVTDTYRHVPFTWEVCGVQAAWRRLPLGARAALLVRLEERLDTIAQNPQAFGRGWVQVDASYCLRRIASAA